MKQTAKIISALLLIFLSQACGLNDFAKQQIKTIDSLGGAVNTAIQTLQKTDTSNLSKLLHTYQMYARFINTKLNDTLSKADALEVKGFFESGESLRAFESNKTKLLQRLNLINNQLGKLSKDIQNRSISEQQAEQYFQSEMHEANQLLPLILEQEKLYFTNLQKLSTSIPLVKEIIKQHNQQQLPFVVETQNN